MYRFGDFTIHHFIEQTFRLDGGSMFGVVPKKIWGKLVSSDDDNLIPMVTNLFVVDTGSKKILCDTGLGTVLSEREKKVYAVSAQSQIETGLAGIGFSANDIDYVVFSHLHTDHSGGAVTLFDGKMMPRFPNARHVVQKREWDDAMYPDERTAAVYASDRLKVIEDAGRLQLVEGDVELLPGVKLIKTGGHTPGHQGMEFSSGGKTVVYYADIIPSSHHFKVPYVASTDLFPLDTMKVKRSLVKRALAGEIIIAFDHDIEIPIGIAVEDDFRTIIKPVA
jgi:glyoxylase-like metal-dependent hydrolase (beta-lactamase superfamily II)